MKTHLQSQRVCPRAKGSETERAGKTGGVCVCERERVCVCARERERDERERERECVCVYVCVASDNVITPTQKEHGEKKEKRKVMLPYREGERKRIARRG
jgi:hypothetical protein